MFSGVTTICFAASYAVLLVLELTRMVFRSGVRGALLVGFAVAGFLAHTIYLANRAVAVERTPLSSLHDWYLLAAWLLVIFYLYELARQPRALIGPFLLPVVLGLIGGAQFAGREPFPHQQASNFWKVVHALMLLLGTVIVAIGFAAGSMYLVQAYRLKSKRPLVGLFRLPSLEWLEAVNSRAVPLSTLLMTGGFVSGVILNRLHGRLSWTDPAILGLGGMLLWLVAATIFNVLYRPARGGRKVAYLTIAGFVFLVIALGTLLVSDTKHVMATSRLPGDPMRSGMGRLLGHDMAGRATGGG